MPAHNLINICVFHNIQYIELFKYLFQSLYFNGKLDDSIDVLVMTDESYKPHIEALLQYYNLPFNVYFMIRPYTTMLESAAARLHIFEYEHIDRYEKILYLDTDILINNDLNVVLNLPIDDNKIYVLKEGTLAQDFYYGADMFDFTVFDKTTPAFTTGILLYKQSAKIRIFFEKVLAHIEADSRYGKPIYICLEQPYIVYNAFMSDMYDNALLEDYVENNPSVIDKTKYIYHFPGGPGNFTSKIDKIMSFSKQVLKYPSVQLPSSLQTPSNTFLIGSVYIIYKYIPHGNNKEEYIMMIKFDKNNVVHTSFDHMKGTYEFIDNNTVIFDFIRDTNIIILNKEKNNECGIFLNTPNNDIYYMHKYELADEFQDIF